MKITTIIIISVFTITTAIRVPTTWHPNAKDERKNKHTTPLDVYRTIQQQGSETFTHQKPHYAPNKRSNKYHNKEKFKTPSHTRPITTNRKKINPSTLSNVKVSSNNWIPIIPQNNAYPAFQKPNKQPNNPTFNRQHLYKNYRDDRTHEPAPFNPYYQSEQVTFDREEGEKAPISAHETPRDIPTRPNYPGEGKWAQPGRKHQPYNQQQQYTTLEEAADPIPDGYEIFQQGEQLFLNQRQNFGKDLQDFPEKHQLGKFVEASHEDESESESEGEHEDSEEDAEAKEAEDFVPMKLYSQVRRSENEEHLPYDEEIPGQLREVIKDSKIQTVYTEEGYEDLAYDHAGQEKNAENEEGFAEFDKELEKEKEKKAPKHLPKIIYTNQNHQSNHNQKDPDTDLEQYKKKQLSFNDEEGGEENDSSSAGTEYNHPLSPPPRNNKVKTMNKNNFIKTKETKTMEVKDKGNGTMEMEISSEVKVVVQPNNSTKSHKYVKIYPKVYRTMSSKAKEEKQLLDKSAELLEQIYPEKSVKNKTEEQTNVYTTAAPINYPETFTEEIPKTTLPTTAIPKVVVKVLDFPQTATEESPIDKIDEAFVKIRKKRFTNDFPKIEIDTKFIDNINHNLPKPKEDLTYLKYPYYQTNNKELNENSPLRYSEDLQNIPKKTNFNMAFYDQANNRVQCQEVETDIDPIPDRVKNAEENAEEEHEETTDIAKTPKSPRLGNLGDKIDCFKLKYFGANPLDSPIFKEELVEPVKPIFSDIGMIQIPKTKVKQKLQDQVTTSVVAKEDATSQESAESEEITTINHLDEENEISSEVDLGKPKDLNKNFEKLPENENNSQEQSLTSSEENDSGGKIPQKSLYQILTEELKTTEEPTIDSNQTGINIYSDIMEKFNTTNEVPSKTKENVTKTENLPTTESSVISIITTPKYTIDLQPKHIYDQIALLKYLPNFNESEAEEQPEAPSNETNSRQGKILKEPGTTTEPITEQPAPETSTMVETLPETQALIKRRRRIRPRRPPIYHIFDVNKFLPTTPLPYYLTRNIPSTVMPKYKVISEVFYKDEIKPNEQLNVFADVLNNIKNSSPAAPAEDSNADSSEPIAVKLNTFSQNSKTKRIKVPVKKFRIKSAPQDSYMNAYDHLDQTSYYTSTTTSSTTTMRPILAYRGRNKHKAHKNNDQFYEELLVTLQNQDSVVDASQTHTVTDTNRPKRRRKTTTTPTPITIIDDKNTVNENLDYQDEPVTQVLGLVPPGTTWQYQTIYSPNSHHKRAPTSEFEVLGETEVETNKFLVPGMKPPLENQKIYLYSDYKFPKSNFDRRNSIPRRGKRSANRPAYSELSRNRGQQEEILEKVPVVVQDEEEDDYVPHRPKNYHYDEKTGKIVYDSVKKEEEKEEEEEEEPDYEEVYEEPVTRKAKPTKPTVKTTKRPDWDKVTPPPAGSSYVDFIKKLKSDKTYHEIPDPTTTEKGEEPAATETVTITNGKSTTPPEFLSLLAKVHGDTNYKVIEDKKKTKATTTMALPEDEEDDEEVEEELGETQLENIKNAPGGQAPEPGNFQIFDITDYLPKIKNYLPKTSVDTSKYKTIERPSVRHNLSSRYNSDDDKPLEEVNTSRKPIILDMTPAAQNQETSESKYETLDESTTRKTTTTSTTTEPSTTTTTTEPSTTTKRPSRVRGRKRTTTIRTLTSPKTIRTTTEKVVVEHEKPKRTYIRRLPTRIKIRTTTEKIEETGDDTTKIIRRRSETETSILNLDQTTKPAILSEEDVIKKLPIVVEDRSDEYIDDYSEPEEREARISTPEDNQNSTNPNQFGGTPGTIEPRKIADVDVFNKNYDKGKKHGGNYRKQQLEESKNTWQRRKPEENKPKEVHPKKSGQEVKIQPEEIKIKRLTDVVPKPFSFYSDPKLPKNVNQLEADRREAVIPTDDLEEIVSVVDESKSEDFGEENFESYDDDFQNNFGNDSTTPKSPIIKDPSKRLYYYAKP